MAHTAIDVNATVAVAEKTALQTKLSLALGAIGVLLTVVNFFFTREITTATSEIKSTRETMSKLTTTVEIQQVRTGYLGERIMKLEQGREDATKTHTLIDQRLNSLEQRVAVYDQIGLEKHLK